MQNEKEYYERKHDKGKPKYRLIPPEWIIGIYSIFEYGAKQYGLETWQTVPNAIERYQDALYRHWVVFLQGEHIDTDSGCHHLLHIAWNALAIWYLQTQQGNEKDNEVALTRWEYDEHGNEVRVVCLNKNGEEI